MCEHRSSYFTAELGSSCEPLNIVNILQSLMPETKKKSQTWYGVTILYLVLERLSKEDCSKFKSNPYYRERDLCQNNNYQES